jgi:hypothetical protein
MLEVYGSKHSLLPRIWEVEAVGMGATRRELRTPCAAMAARRPAQSHRSEGAGAPHMSCWRTPLETGEPA